MIYDSTMQHYQNGVLDIGGNTLVLLVYTIISLNMFCLRDFEVQQPLHTLLEVEVQKIITARTVYFGIL